MTAAELKSRHEALSVGRRSRYNKYKEPGYTYAGFAIVSITPKEAQLIRLLLGVIEAGYKPPTKHFANAVQRLLVVSFFDNAGGRTDRAMGFLGRSKTKWWKDLAGRDRAVWRCMAHLAEIMGKGRLTLPYGIWAAAGIDHDYAAALVAMYDTRIVFIKKTEG